MERVSCKDIQTNNEALTKVEEIRTIKNSDGMLL